MEDKLLVKKWIKLFIARVFWIYYFFRYRFKIGENTRIKKILVRETNNIKIGSNSFIDDYVILNSGHKLGSIEIGNNSFIGAFSLLDGTGSLNIGNDVMIATHVRIVAANHNFDRIDIPMKNQGITGKGIKINNDVWIGTGAVILDGVNVGEGSIVAAHSVVTKDVPDFSIVAGVPATIKKKR